MASNATSNPAAPPAPEGTGAARPRRLTRAVPAAAVLLTLALLGAAVLYTRAELRAQLRDQLAHRDGQLVEVLFRRKMAAGESGGGGDPLAALLEAARIPELPGVWSVALFDRDGRWIGATPATAEKTELDPALAREARAGAPASRFTPDLDAAREFLVPPDDWPAGGVPGLEIVLITPGPGGDAAGGGYARLLLDGAGLAREFERLDDHLARAAWRAFAVTGGAIALILGFAFLRLEQSHRRLQQANRELTLAAKTGAIGAVSSHLIHGIKNPIAGLQRFLAERSREAGDDAEWLDAADAARRIRTLVDEVTRVLRDEGGLVRFEIGCDEVVETLAARLAALAKERRVRLGVESPARDRVGNREANLALLVLENLAVNALEATPVGGEVRLSAAACGGTLEFRVTDTGPGLPDSVRSALFTPAVSSKRGGAGLGLAISHQIAVRLGGSLALARSDAHGTEFVLRVPISPGDRT